MKNDKKIYERIRFIKNYKINDESNPYNKELMSLFSSAKENKEKNTNDELKLIKDLLTSENNKKKEKNLLDKFINEKVSINKHTLNRELFSNSNNFNNNKENPKTKMHNFDNKYEEKGTFITKMNIIGRKSKLRENEKNNCLGKSLNDTLIKNIKVEMIKKGILLEKPLSAQKTFKKEKPSVSNYNNFDFHMKIFKTRIMKEFKKAIKDYELSKKNLKNLSEDLAIKKELMTKKIPIYIKGFKKNGKDVFHSRKLYDVQYQKRYQKPSINLEELIQNHNQYSTSKLKKEKMPFYHFLRTVNNPFQNLKVSQKRNHSGQIILEFNEKEAKRFNY